MERWREDARRHLHSKMMLSWLIGMTGLAILMMAIFYPQLAQAL